MAVARSAPLQPLGQQMRQPAAHLIIVNGADHNAAAICRQANRPVQLVGLNAGVFVSGAQIKASRCGYIPFDQRSTDLKISVFGLVSAL